MIASVYLPERVHVRACVRVCVCVCVHVCVCVRMRESVRVAGAMGVNVFMHAYLVSVIVSGRQGCIFTADHNT